MGSIYASPVLHARGEIQANLCSSRMKHLNSIPSIDRMACIVAVKKGANTINKHQEFAHSLSLSSSATVPIENMVLSSSNSKSLIRFRSYNCKAHCLAYAANLTQAESIQSSSAAPTEHNQQPASNPTRHDERTPLKLSEGWREIQGEKHWDGLLDHPINATLRAEIIRYGEFAQVCYDAFDFNKHSLYCGSCKFNRRALFEKVDKEGCGYEVTKFLYATSKLDLPKFFRRSERDEEGRWSCDSNWIGYIAVCTDEAEVRRIGRRDILIAWRGTVTTTEWVDDLMTTQSPANIEQRPAGGLFVTAPPPSHSQQHAINVELESRHKQSENAKLSELHNSPFAHVEPAPGSNPFTNADLASSNSPFSDVAIEPLQCAPLSNVQLAGTQDCESVEKHIIASNTKLATQSRSPAAQGDEDVTKHGKDANSMISRYAQSAQNDEDVSGVVKVESGFLSLYSSSKARSRFNKLSAGQQMAVEVKRLLQKYEGEEVSISVTGHSLGAALALLCAYDIAANVAPPPNTVVPPNAPPDMATASVAAAKSSSCPPTVAKLASPSYVAAPRVAATSSYTPLNIVRAFIKASAIVTSLHVASPPSTAAAASVNPAAAPNTPIKAAASVDPAAAPNTPTVAAIPKNSATPPNEAAPPHGVDQTGANSLANMCRSAALVGAAASPVITVFSFAGPRVGNKAFKRRLEELGVRVLRIVNVHDCVPKVPGVLFNERSAQPNIKVWPIKSGYHHVGKELLIDFDSSPHLRRTRDLASHHNLEAHLHVLDGFQGLNRPFQSLTKRNHVLVNKSSDFLKKEAFIPPSWWQESNKGLVKDPSSGQWVLASREDDHLPEIHHLDPKN